MNTLKMNYLRHYINENNNTVVVFSENKVSQTHVNKVLNQDYSKGTTTKVQFGSVKVNQWVPFLKMNGGKEVYCTFKGETKFSKTQLSEIKDNLWKVSVGKPRTSNGVSSEYKFSGSLVGKV